MNTGIIKELKATVLQGIMIDREEAEMLIEVPLDELCAAANEIRKHFCGNIFDICTIINGKSGRCSENCKYCAQSVFYKTKVDTYGVLDTQEIVAGARYNEDKGVLRYSIVTAGKSLNDKEIAEMCNTVKAINKQGKINVCVSFGLLNEEQYKKMYDAGVRRVHNNLEASEHYFPNICTTHSFQDKVKAIKAAQRAGMNVCSGGIMGLGETMSDRIDMALSLRKLKVKSVPVNMLNPIPYTPFEHNKVLTNDEMARIVAIYRFILPDVSIRLAGGRGLLPDKGKKCFQSGANAAISGDMLTTSGITIDTDMNMIKELGFKVGLWNE
ncbi:biotin synthase BioB [Pectinatus sottacetonis]|uniref:biotin synthase BioB n=1 Tax=Pectinatus sottacetonis TaxID=1002795 RepID=UPI0018C5ACAF|nr:biotin synthase BioB [Pectinatus sottacetonis]